MASSINEIAALVLINTNFMVQNMVAGLETSELELLLASVGEACDGNAFHKLELMARCWDLLQQGKLSCTQVMEQYQSRMTRSVVNEVSTMMTPNTNPANVWNPNQGFNTQAPNPPSMNLPLWGAPPQGPPSGTWEQQVPSPGIWGRLGPHPQTSWCQIQGSNTNMWDLPQDPRLVPTDPRQRPHYNQGSSYNNQGSSYNNQGSTWRQGSPSPARRRNHGSRKRGRGQSSATSKQKPNPTASSYNRNPSALSKGADTRANAGKANAVVNTRANPSTSTAKANEVVITRANPSTSTAKANAVVPAKRLNANAAVAAAAARRPTVNVNANVAVAEVSRPTVNAARALTPSVSVGVPSTQRLSHDGLHIFEIGRLSSQKPSVVKPQPSPQSLVNLQMRPLPFYEVLGVILEPTRLSSDQSVAAASLPAMHRVKFQFPRPKQIAQAEAIIRFCEFDLTSSMDHNHEYDDHFPPKLTVEVNCERIRLPQQRNVATNTMENGPATPLAVSNMKSLDRPHNMIQLTWYHDNKAKNYAVSIYLMKRRTGKDLVKRLRERSVRDRKWTLAMIRKMTTVTDNEVCPQIPIIVSLACPVGKLRMRMPCRPLKCNHLQCFDAEIFICMQQKKPFRVFKCPVCNKPVNFDDFSIDGYFTEILGKLDPDADFSIAIQPDGTWTPAKPEKEKTRNATSTSFERIHDTIDLDDDDEEEIDENIQSNMISSSSCINVSSPPATKSCELEPEVIDLDSSASVEDNESSPEAEELTPIASPGSVTEEISQKEREPESCSDSSDLFIPSHPSTSQKRKPKPKTRKLKLSKKYKRIVVKDDSSDSDSK